MLLNEGDQYVKIEMKMVDVPIVLLFNSFVPRGFTVITQTARNKEKNKLKKLGKSFNLDISLEVYLEPCQISNMERFEKIVNG